MHIHPALTVVVQRACIDLMTPEEYHVLIAEQIGVNVS
jgi:hypothetical protein